MRIDIDEKRLKEHVKRICRGNIRKGCKICNETCPIRTVVDWVLMQDETATKWKSELKGERDGKAKTGVV